MSNGGAFFLARKLFESELWLDKPASWKVIWIYIIGNVNHASNSRFNRGEAHFNFTREKHDIGIDITPDMIKKCLAWLRGSGMISTTRSTRGMIVKVLKYDEYQDLKNYNRSTTRSTSKARDKHERSTTINKNDKNDKNVKNNTYVHELEEFIKVFNSMFDKSYRVTDGRKKKWSSRRKNFELDQIYKALENLSQSPWHRGVNERGWQADPDFLLRSDEQIDTWSNKDMKKAKEIAKEVKKQKGNNGGNVAFYPGSK